MSETGAFIFYVVTSSAGILYWINKNISHPYMDEQFHLDQCTSYLVGNYSYWNPKLTTFPGAFILTAVFVYLLNAMNLLQDILSGARLFTTILGVGNSYFLGYFNFFNSERNTLMFQTIITMLPISFFYNFLFYTDTFSTTFITLFFFMVLYKNSSKIVIAILGVLCVMVRQNNIVWINLFLLSQCFEILFKMLRSFSFRSLANEIKDCVIDNINVIAIDLAFIAFLIHNNFSVVLGDKSHHKMTIHLAQINHFLFFFLVFFPMVNFKIFRLIYKEFYTKENLKKFAFFFVLILLAMLFFNKYSYTHDFLLSDNRHYSFYYFRKIYNDLQIRYIMIVWSSIIYSLIALDNSEIISDTRMMSYGVCLCMVLIPAQLFEFRYFTLGYVILLILIHHDYARWRDIYNFIFNKYNLMWSLVINAVTLFVFIQKPFKNSYFSFEESRFMW